MERLTTKELAPYLPYGLKLYIWNGGYEKPIEYPTLIGLHGDSIIQSGYRFKSIHCGDEIFSRPEMSNSLSIIKPLLRPMSSLTEVFQFGDYDTRIEEIVKEAEQHFDAYDEWLEIFIDDPDPSRILQAPYEVVQKLIERKYDVFGLIDRGLALHIDGKEVKP